MASKHPPSTSAKAKALIQPATLTRKTATTRRVKPVVETARALKLRAAAQGSVATGSRLAGDFPGIATIDITALAPLPSVGPADNLLLASVKAIDIEVEVTMPLAGDNRPIKPGDELFLILDGDIANEASAKYEITSETFGEVVKLSLLAAKRPNDGTYTLSYVIANAFQTIHSSEIKFVVDTTAPGGTIGFASPDFRELDAIIITEGITTQLLDEQGGQLTAYVPNFQGLALDDSIVPFVNGSAGTPTFMPDPATSPTEVAIVYTAAQITAESDGLNKFTYQITDRAGNVGNMSLAEEYETLLNGAIDDLLAPTVAEFDSDSLIIEEEARDGVWVTIPPHVKLLVGDEVYVTWGSTRLLLPAVVEDPANSFDVFVSAAQVFSEGSGTISVQYEVNRGSGSTAKILVGVSPPTAVEVDLTGPGGVDPDPETPWNENLQRPTVTGASGTANHLKLEDAELNAKITIPFLTSEAPAKAAFKAGDLISVYWGGTPPGGAPVGEKIAAEYTVLQTDVDNQIIPDLTILPAEHQKEGAGNIIVTYRASRPLGAGLFNHSASPNQTVLVESLADVPGGPGGLPDVVWTEAQQSRTEPYFYALITDYSKDGSVLQIPYYLNKKEGDVITITYQAREGGFGPPPGSTPGPEIPSTAHTAVHKVTGITEVNGPSSVTMPSKCFFKTVPATPDGVYEGFQGSCIVSYTVTPEGSSTATPKADLRISIETRW